MEHRFDLGSMEDEEWTMAAETMKAVRQHAFGGPHVLRYEDAPRPSPKAGEVLVRVHAIGINPPDWYLREATGPSRRNGSRRWIFRSFSGPTFPA